jgi:hypothetical protein
MLEIFFPFTENTIFFTLVGLGLFLLYSKRGRRVTWFHLDLLMVLAWVPLPDYEVGNLKITTILGWLPLFYWIPRLLFLLMRDPRPEAEVRLATRHLKVLAGIAASYLIFLALISPYPFGDFGDYEFHLSDSAMLGYSGGAHILAGELPYPEGDVEFKGNHSYGPAYFLMYVPVAYFFPEAEPHEAYDLGARLFAIVVALIGALALFRLGRRLGGAQAGWGWVVFWLASPYLHNAVYWAQASHLLPGALTAVALAAAFHSPTLGGAALGLVASVSYYPLLFLPFLARASRHFMRFAIACGAVVAVFFLPILVAPNGLPRFLRHVIFMEGTLVGQEGWSPWSPWAQYPSLAPVRTALMIAYAMILVFAFVWTWQKKLSLRAAVAGSAIVVAGFQIWKEHAPGRYHLWLFPLLLVHVLWPAATKPGERPA